jgi:signal transduction histidine kinase
MEVTTGAHAWRTQLALAGAAALVGTAACMWLWSGLGPTSTAKAGVSAWLRVVAVGLALIGPIGLMVLALSQARRERALASQASVRQASQRRVWLELLDLLPVAVAICGTREPTLAPNRALRQLLGTEGGVATPLALDWLQIVAAEDQAAWTASVASALGTKRAQWLRCDMRLAGTSQEVLAQLAPMEAEDGVQLLIVSLSLAQGEAGLAQDTVLQLRALLAMAEAEKWQFGQAVHDELGQRLSGIAYFSKALQRKLQVAQRAEADDAGWLTRLANETMSVSRGLARGLVPVGSDDESALALALTELCERAGKTFEIECSLQVDPGFDAGGAARASHLYHAIQELVTNAVKHGRAQHVQVSLEVFEMHQRVTVRNDGLGLGSTPTRPGMGVHGVRSRVAYLGGHFTLTDDSQGGVLASIEMPSTSDPISVPGSTGAVDSGVAAGLQNSP